MIFLSDKFYHYLMGLAQWGSWFIDAATDRQYRMSICCEKWKLTCFIIYKRIITIKEMSLIIILHFKTQIKAEKMRWERSCTTTTNLIISSYSSLQNCILYPIWDPTLHIALHGTRPSEWTTWNLVVYYDLFKCATFSSLELIREHSALWDSIFPIF